ncbi:hypothetical protein C8Q76DRAFT_790402 [Earliella scabrosa]|nr:hypothetical protein C8Q76DRAFT_790402 [Earliella scabrosa]
MPDATTTQAHSVNPANAVDGGATEGQGNEAQPAAREGSAGGAETVAGAVADVGHGILEVSVDVLQLVPIAGLQEAARLVLKIWEAIEAVKHNQADCRRLAERSDALLKWVRSSIARAGNDVAAELEPDIDDFARSLRRVYDAINRVSNKSFIKRYLARNEVAKTLRGCNEELADVHDRLADAIAMATLKQSVAAKRENELLAAKVVAAERNIEHLAAATESAKREREQNTAALLAAIHEAESNAMNAIAAAERERKQSTAAILSAIATAERERGQSTATILSAIAAAERERDRSTAALLSAIRAAGSGNALTAESVAAAL